MPRITLYLIAMQLLFSNCGLVLADTSDPCDDDRGDSVLRCSEKRLAEAKKEMASVFASLRKRLHTSQVKAFDESKKHWLRYVKSYCSVAADPLLGQPNSTSSQIYWGIAMENYCHMRLTKERTANLSRVLACIQEGGSENCS
ncbi:MAG: DUF1311 domain-containing protein [Rhodocyclaceae bacterium]|nr:DUF1311 domain-containing protein [Rhodocyclaceae bacterium]